MLELRSCLMESGRVKRRKICFLLCLLDSRTSRATATMYDIVLEQQIEYDNYSNKRMFRLFDIVLNIVGPKTFKNQPWVF